MSFVKRNKTHDEFQNAEKLLSLIVIGVPLVKVPKEIEDGLIEFITIFFDRLVKKIYRLKQNRWKNLELKA